MVPHTFLVPVNKITAIYHIISRVKELDVLKRLNCCSPTYPFQRRIFAALRDSGSLTKTDVAVEEGSSCLMARNTPLTFDIDY
jgi:hypothetical protein